MKYLNQKSILALVGVTLGILVVWGFFNSPAVRSKDVENGAVATTTVREPDEQVVVATTSKKTAAQGEASIAANTESPDTALSQPANNVVRASIDSESTSTNASQIGKVAQKDLGPRQKASLPGDALLFFVEAASAGDVDRAVSYMHHSIQDPYRVTLEGKYKERLHPVVYSYLYGTVENVELIEPESGLYEIAVYPGVSGLPFRVNIRYDNTVGEFVITEL